MATKASIVGWGEIAKQSDGDQDISIPAGTQLFVICARNNTNAENLTYVRLDGTGCTLGDRDTGDAGSYGKCACGTYYMVTPPTGTVACTWAATNTGNWDFVWFALDGINPVDAVMDCDVNSTANTERYVGTSCTVNVDGPETLVVGRVNIAGELEAETTTDSWTSVGGSYGGRYAEGPSDGTFTFSSYKSGSGAASKVNLQALSVNQPPVPSMGMIVLG